MTKSELSDCGLIWNTSRNSICLDDFLKRYDGISKDITIESKPNGYNVIHETLHNMMDVHDFLLRMMTCKIKLTKVEIESYTIAAYPEIYVEYFVSTDATVTGILETPNNIGVDTCSHDDTLDYLKREMKKQFTEELERAKIKDEPKKEETVLEFKEISW